MLYYDRIDMSEGIDKIKEEYQKSAIFVTSDTVILKIKNDDYRCIISGISKIEAINLMQNIDLTEKS